MTEYVNSFRLGGYFPDATTLPAECTSTLFGVLVGLAEGTVEYHKSDLYHDANQLKLAEGTLKDGQVLVYGVRVHGTEFYLNAEQSIGSRSAVELAEAYNDKVCTLMIEKRDLGEWYAVVYRVK